MLVCNIHGGAGFGKSTLAMQVASTLKQKGYSAEYVDEYAKDCVWSDLSGRLQDQLIVLAEQHHKIKRLMGKVDVAIVDSPLTNSLIYDTHYKSREFQDFVLSLYKSYWTLDFLITIPEWAKEKFERQGRVHTYEQAIAIHEDISEKVSGLGAIKLTGDFSKDHEYLVNTIVDVLDYRSRQRELYNAFSH